MRQAVPEIHIAPKVAIRLSGTGGQGLLLAGRILAEAVAIYDGLNAVQSNSYGPEARGGASRSEVVVSPDVVDDLHCETFDILVCLSQKACDAYFHDLKEDGVLIVDSTNVTVVPTSRAVEAPMTRMAVEECGDRVVTNTISLGVLCGFTKVVTLGALESAIKSTLRPDLVPMNLNALKLGHAVAEEFIASLPKKRREQIRDYSFSGSKVVTKKAGGRR